MINRQRTLALVSALALLAVACGGDGAGPLELGVRRIALKLIFADEELAVPLEPRRIVRIVPVPPEFRAPIIERRQIPQIPPLLPPCPKAPEGARPGKPTTHIIEHPPAVARYPRLNRGTISVVGLFTFPFPFLANWEIPAIEQVESSGALDPVTGAEPQEFTEFEVHKRWFQGFSQIERFRITSTALQLVKRTTKVQGAADRVFVPDPPIDFYRYGLLRSSWSQNAIDLESRTAMVRDATIVARELVDVCGVLVDTIRFEVTEQMVNLESGETTGTFEGDPIVYNIATQFGGILIREDVHYRFTSADPETGDAVVVEFDYVSTQSNHEPQPIPKGAGA